MAKGKIDNVLREAVRRSGRSLNTLSRESGVPLSSLSRFVNESRDIRLLSAGKLIDALGLDLTLIQLLREPARVDAALEEIIQDAKQHISAVGNRSWNREYLRAIETAVTKRSVAYSRLLTGYTIGHVMHEHLRRLLQSPCPRVRVRKTTDLRYKDAASDSSARMTSERIPHMTVTDLECVILLPTASSRSYFGLRLTGYAHALGFNQFFSELFGAYDNEQNRVDQATLSELCFSCSYVSPLYIDPGEQSDEAGELFWGTIDT